ncbi:MAG: LamG domain-containing protein [Kiritimatiellae bacterium]|nr:LamG domain-containing protein [Kiritimatiellia bacterium]
MARTLIYAWLAMGLAWGTCGWATENPAQTPASHALDNEVSPTPVPTPARLEKHRPSALQASLLLHYDFSTLAPADSNGIPRLVDGSGHADAVILGSPRAIRGIGKQKTALRFDGLQDALRIPRQPEFEPEVVSAALWFRMHNAWRKNGFTTVFLKRNHNFHYNEDYSLGYHPGGRLDICAGHPDQSQARGEITRNLDDGKWHHAVCTYSHKHVRLYLDGEQVLDIPNTGPLDHNPETDLWIAGADHASGLISYTAIDLDDFRLYAAELTPRQVRKLYREKAAAAAKERPVRVQRAVPPPPVTSTCVPPPPSTCSCPLSPRPACPPRRHRPTSPAPSTTLADDLELILRFGRENGYASPAYLDLLETTLRRHQATQTSPYPPREF